MKTTQCQNKALLPLAVLIFLACLSACDNDQGEVSETQTINTNALVENIQAPSTQAMALPETAPQIENKRYLFDITKNSIEELEALLIRAEEVSQNHPKDFEDIEIVMVIHGPDIDLFTKDNYEHNQKLINLAARLDAYDIIDMKVCEKTMEIRGVERSEIPSFIESVPYAPTEIKQRLEQGYINL